MGSLKKNTYEQHVFESVDDSSQSYISNIDKKKSF